MLDLFFFFWGGGGSYYSFGIIDPKTLFKLFRPPPHINQRTQLQQSVGTRRLTAETRGMLHYKSETALLKVPLRVHVPN